MKTNVIMTRQMGQFEVFQRTSDGMFNATGLLKQWNISNGTNKEVKEFLRNDQTQAFIEVLKVEEYSNGDNYPYLATRGNKGATWMHPFLFIKFAMWLNPKFEYQVIKFVYDELIKHRHLAGDNYNKLCSALARFQGVDYPEVGRMLNYVVFNTHERGIRNNATPDKEADLQQLERDMCQYIDMGFVTNYNQFKSVMRREWTKRHGEVPVLV